MASFYEKLSMKLRGTGDPPADPPARKGAPNDPPAKGAAPATGAAGPKGDPPGDPPASEAQPDGTDLVGVDLFQSDERIVIFVQASGVGIGDFDVTADEESDTLILQATQKRPDIPLQKDAKEVEKGRYAKQEIKWGNLYRKIYLPAPFDAAGAEAFVNKGVLVVVLPVKKLGQGKKLAVRDITEEEQKKEEQKK